MTDPQPPAPEGETSSELQSIVRFRFHDGTLDEFKRLSAECLEIVRSQDPGTLQYDTFFNEDESECIVLERFRDLDALLVHGANIGDERMEAIVATGECSGELLGPVPEEVRANLAGGPVQVFLPYQAL
ncbi:MAG: putative quinol monooxygenase [Acidimicrobiales bacterium]